MAKVALITGAARRIGREIATTLHAAGFDIALHYNHSLADANSLATTLNDARVDSCRLFQGELTQLEQVSALGKQVVAHYQGLDLLVNNASGFKPTPIEDCTEADFDAMLDTNLKAPYFLIQSTLEGLRRKGGSIVNLLDLHATRPLPDYNAYCAAKAGMASLTRSLAIELGPDIRVNGVAPGAILWPEGEADLNALQQQNTVAATALKRLGDPADIAKAVRFLACDAPFVTGEVIAVDGGRTLNV